MTPDMRRQLERLSELLTETTDPMAQVTYLYLLGRFDPEGTW